MPMVEAKARIFMLPSFQQCRVIMFGGVKIPPIKIKIHGQ